MTIGIYALYWAEQDLIYIGQSQNIEVRFREHISLMRRCKHTNYKVQNTFNLYGVPTLNILEICKIEDTNTLEVYWTKEFDALQGSHGLCIIEPGLVGWGTNSNSSKYSRSSVLKVFSLLYKKNSTVPQIVSRTKVSKSVVQDILVGDSHLWLQEAYPTQYALMQSRVRQTSNISKKLQYTPKLVSPEGVIYEITNITEFCKCTLTSDATSVPSKVRGIARVIDGTRKQYKGWKVYNSL